MLNNSKTVAEALAEDGEFCLVSKGWTGGLQLKIGDDQVIDIALNDGKPKEGPAAGGDWVTISGPAEIWQALFQTVPARLTNDIAVAMLAGLQLETDELFYTQYYPAVARAIEVIRGPNPDQVQTVNLDLPEGRHDTPVGQYTHLNLGGHDHRIYYEEAGEGIPILLQHTAGSHGTQWRHLFEYRQITDRFRLIAYDLPFHGKSVPPTGKQWWSETYALRGEFLRSVPLKLARALELDSPVFMGCSVGGALALDLAARHPGAFKAVISVEGALNMDQDANDYVHNSFFHPQVSNQFKGRLMHALTSPTAPEAYRQETIQTYMSGWPQSFIGDLQYYAVEYDIRNLAASIDTSKTAVHIMNGEYDFSGSWEKGEEAHMAIAGSTWTKMVGMGHFPMCEDPERFVEYLMPLLDQIEAM